MKPQRVICGTPFTDWTHSGVVGNWLNLSPQPALPWISQFGSYLPEAHNRVIDQFLRRHDGDRLLMLENDMVVASNIVAHCRLHKADIVTGLYFSRRRPHMPIMYKAVSAQGRAVNMDHLTLAELFEAPHGEHEIGATGTGILSIARHVFELMPQPWFEPSPEAISEGHYGGHDMYFCAKARALGMSIAYDNSPAMVAEHVGTSQIGIRNYLAEVKALEQQNGKTVPR